jgi:hypothetical protein
VNETTNNEAHDTLFSCSFGYYSNSSNSNQGRTNALAAQQRAALLQEIRQGTQLNHVQMLLDYPLGQNLIRIGGEFCSNTSPEWTPNSIAFNRLYIIFPNLLFLFITYISESFYRQVTNRLRVTSKPF